MSKLRKLVIDCRVEGDQHYYETTLEYSPSLQRFFIRVPNDQILENLPDEEGKCLWRSTYINRNTSIDSFTGETEKEVINKARRYYKIFMTATRSEERVILYKFSYECGDLVSDRVRRHALFG